MDKTGNVEGFGDRLRELVDKTGLTHAQFALNAGLSRATLSNYITGRSEPRLAGLVSLSKILNTTPNYLLGVTTINSEKAQDSLPPKDISLEEIIQRVVELERGAKESNESIKNLQQKVQFLEGGQASATTP